MDQALSKYSQKKNEIHFPLENVFFVSLEPWVLCSECHSSNMFGIKLRSWRAGSLAHVPFICLTLHPVDPEPRNFQNSVFSLRHVLAWYMWERCKKPQNEWGEFAKYEPSLVLSEETFKRLCLQCYSAEMLEREIAWGLGADGGFS